MSCMFSMNVCVPAGGFAQLIAGEVPAPGAAPAAAWLNLTGTCAPSGNPGIVIVKGAGPAGVPPPAAPRSPRCPPRPPRSCAASDKDTIIEINTTPTHRNNRIASPPLFSRIYYGLVGAVYEGVHEQGQDEHQQSALA